MLGAQPVGAYGWLPTLTGLLLFLTVCCDAGPGATVHAVWEGKSLNVGNALRKSVVKTKTQCGGSNTGRSLLPVGVHAMVASHRPFQPQGPSELQQVAGLMGQQKL